MSQGDQRDGTQSEPDEPSASGHGVPPWQRVTSQVREEHGEHPVPPASGQLSEQEAPEPYAAGPGDEAPTMIHEPVGGDERETLFAPGGGNEGAQSGGRTQVNLNAPRAGQERGTGTPSALRRPGRGPRRASLQLKRVDPWSVLKLAFVLSVAFFLVLLVAVGVLYAVLGGMGVWDKINGTYSDFVSTSGSGNPEPLITIGRVFAVTAVVGIVNVILFTAVATVASFVYNVSADLAGGLEVTLAERE